MPWAFIPFLMLLSIWIAPAGDLLWNFQTLLIPVAAWIGYRYGIDGVKAVFYASIPLLLFRYNGEIAVSMRFHFGTSGGTLLAALAMAWLAAAPENPEKLASYLREKPARLAWLLLIPLTYVAPAIGGFQIRLDNSLSVNVAFFILGLIHAPLKRPHLICAIGGMVCIGIVAIIAEVLLREGGVLSFELGRPAYLFFSPQDVISVVLFLFAGVWTRTFLKTGEMPRSRFLWNTPILLIAIMIYSQMQFGLLPGFSKSIGVTGDGYVSILCCLLAGLFFQKRGILIVLPPLLVLSLLSPAFDEFRNLGEALLPMDMRFYIWTRPPDRVFSLILELFLWTCVGAQLRAWSHTAQLEAPRSFLSMRAETKDG